LSFLLAILGEISMSNQTPARPSLVERSAGRAFTGCSP